MSEIFIGDGHGLHEPVGDMNRLESGPIIFADEVDGRHVDGLTKERSDEG